MHLSPHQSHARRFLVVRWLLGMLAAIMMLVGQFLAVGAVQSGGGAWIEICAGSGTKLVQTEDPTPTNSCAHCEFCAVQFSVNTPGPLPATFFGPVTVFAHVQFISVSVNAKPAAEQFWAANRGPPLTSEENMTPISALWAAMINPALRRASWL